MTDDDLTDAEKSKMAGNLLRMGKARTGLKVETRRSRLPPGPKPISRFEIVPGKIEVDLRRCKPKAAVASEDIDERAARRALDVDGWVARRRTRDAE